MKNLFVKMLIAGTLLMSANMAFPMVADQPDTGAPIPIPPVSLADQPDTGAPIPIPPISVIALN